MIDENKYWVMDSVRSMPDNSSTDDVIERLIFLKKIEDGMKSLKEGKSIPHDEVVKQFREKWQRK